MSFSQRGSREGNNKGTFPPHISWELFKIHRSYIREKTQNTAEGKRKKRRVGHRRKVEQRKCR